MNRVESYYDDSPEREWERLEKAKIQFDIAMKIIKEHLPNPPAKIIDIGGGVGRYAIAFSKEGYDVTLVDLSNKSLVFANNKATELNTKISNIMHADATNLSNIKNIQFDAALIMGPLYHLSKKNKRIKVITEVKKLLKPKGLIFADFLSKFSIIQWAACSQPDQLEKESNEYKQMLLDGKYTRPDDQNIFVDCWGTHPYDIEPFMKSCGFNFIDMGALECLVFNQYSTLCNSHVDLYNEWLEIIYGVCRDKSLWGSAGHLLYVGALE